MGDTILGEYGLKDVLSENQITSMTNMIFKAIKEFDKKHPQLYDNIEELKKHKNIYLSWCFFTWLLDNLKGRS